MFPSFRNVTRDIKDVLESITLKYEDGRIENRDFYDVRFLP